MGDDTRDSFAQLHPMPAKNDPARFTMSFGDHLEELRTYLMAGRGLARTLRAGVSVSLSASPEHVHLIPVA